MWGCGGVPPKWILDLGGGSLARPKRPVLRKLGYGSGAPAHGKLKNAVLTRKTNYFELVRAHPNFSAIRVARVSRSYPNCEGIAYQLVFEIIYVTHTHLRV